MGMKYRSVRILATIVVAVIIACSVIGYLWDRNGNSLDFSDTETLIVISGSMDGEPREQYDIETIPVESLIFVRHVPGDPVAAERFYSSLEAGDVLTFDYIHPVSGEHMLVTHRIISISGGEGNYIYTLQGDTMADDPTNGSVQVVTSSSGDVVGKVVGVSPWLGSAVVLLSHWYGKLLLIVIPCAIIIASELRNIIRTVRSERTEPAAEEVGETRDLMADENLFRRL